MRDRWDVFRVFVLMKWLLMSVAKLEAVLPFCHACFCVKKITVPDFFHSPCQNDMTCFGFVTLAYKKYK